MNDKLLSFLGIARRAGRLSLGCDAATEAMQGGKSKLLLLASDLSERTARNMKHTAEQTRTQTIVLDRTMEQLGGSVGKMTGIISVNDEGFAKKLVTLCTE
ncbi:MAG: ribosomal L7Ae/L30e/S12e/Gadd45 family protein [Clostridia bacterium]|nr:ribosomal L7Ae/L30e/S12e/Gadd45 family protein [Clostridia bacterium]